MSGKDGSVKNSLSEADLKVLRYAFGATLATAFALGFDWYLSYLTPVLALSFLSSPAGRPSLKTGIGFVLIIASAGYLSLQVGKLLIPYPLAFIPFIGLFLFRIYYEKGGRLAPVIILWLLITLLVIPMIMMYKFTISRVVAVSLVIDGLFALIAAWVAYAFFPEKKQPRRTASALPSVVTPTERYEKALDSILVVFPVLILFYLFRLSGALLVLIYIALLSTQPQFAKDFKSGKALIIGNAIGGLAATLFYEALVIVPEFYFLLLITFLMGLVFGKKLFSGKPSAALFGMSYSTFILIIGSVTTSSGDEAGAEIYTRIVQIMSAVVYLVAASGLLEYFKKKQAEKKSVKMKKKIPAVITLFLAFMLSGCSLGPDYIRPDSLTLAADSARFRQPDSSGESIANLSWWELFGDSVLQDLIREGLKRNRNLRSSLARIEEARANLRVVRADLYPRIDFSAGGSYDKKFGNNSSSGGSGTLALDVSYQVDLWGRISRSNEAAAQQLLSTEAAYRNVTISLVSEIAGAYLLLRDIDNRLLIARNTAETRRKSLDVIEAKYDAGIVAEVDVSQSEIQLADAKASVKSFERLRGQTENIINLLLSKAPGKIERGKTLQEQLLIPNVPAGLPSELLERRPDLLEAEHNLHAQTARMGVAEALKYPQLNLSADMGTGLNDLPSFFAGLGAQLFGPVFNAGANQSRVDIETARTKQLLNKYEQTFYTALREVEDAMIAAKTYREEYLIRKEQVKSAKNAVELSWVRYKSGMTSYLEVLDVQRSLFAAELKASESLQLELTSVITLYKALGGGWSPEREDTESAN
jgi:multidrug efflux system outer membrane protein